MSDKIVMVCARWDAPRTVPGGSARRFCSRCFTRLMTAPSGEEFLAAHPRVRLICSECFGDVPKEEITEILLACPPERVLLELSASIPNPARRSRGN